MKLKPTERLPIYHSDGLGDVFDACRSIAEISEEQKKSLRLCFNGTLVTVTPGMDGKQVFSQWGKNREEYTLNKVRSVICPICKLGK